MLRLRLHADCYPCHGAVGILGIPGTFGVLGFVPGLISLLLLCAITTLSSWYIAKIRMRYPQIHSVGDFGYMIGGRWGGEIFGWSYCIVFILFAGAAVEYVYFLFCCARARTTHGKGLTAPRAGR